VLGGERVFGDVGEHPERFVDRVPQALGVAAV
jgi:hypothetical protein